MRRRASGTIPGRIEAAVCLLALALVGGVMSAWQPVVADAAPAAQVAVPGTFVPLPPTRVLDTRTGLGYYGPVGPNATVHLQIAGTAGVPSTGVAAVVLNVTETNATGSGNITVYPDGTTEPTASNLNFPAGDTRANLATVKLGANGGIALTNNNLNTVDLVGDIAGYYLAGTPSTPGAFVPLNPTRVLDTRTGLGYTGPVGGNATVHLQIAGTAGVPSTGVAAVVLNVTETNATGSGNITVYPDGTTKPTASNLNFPAGDTRANLATVKLGSNGKIALTNNNLDTVQLVGDIAGYYLAGTSTATGAFVPLSPTRVLDTRTALGGTGPVGGNATVHLQIAGTAGVPSTGVAAVVLNVTETNATGSGNITVYPDGTTKPTASNLNFPAGDTRANLATVKLGSNGKIALTNNNLNTVQLVGDIAGYYLAGDTTPPGPVTGLSTTTASANVTLTWTNPTASDFAGVMIRRAPGTTPPSSPTAGTLVTTTSASTTSYIDSGVASGTTYSYALFAFDKVPNYSRGTTATATTIAETTRMPANDWSYYVTSLNLSTASSLGCSQGKYDASHGNIDSNVTLDFGGQNSSNTGTYLTFSNTSVSYSDIEAYAENFAYNYWACTGSGDKTSRLTLALGTNNSAYYVNSAGGAAWAGVVNTVTSYLQSHGYGQVVVWGASDIEVEWNSYANTANWESGYASHTSAMYVDFGDASGCPPYGSCLNGWTQYQVWMIAWGFPPSQVEPEVYYSGQGTEWQAISNTQGKIHFWSVMDEYPLDSSSLTATGAWSALGCSTGAQSCANSTEIHKSN